ncbi:hypothetical protein PENSPDRAFT_736356 [Peniophora sp. CONT]|nr:hypothetical protein PENSPDRAFT_736356 [Peniophora sp. CONT]
MAGSPVRHYLVIWAQIEYLVHESAMQVSSKIATIFRASDGLWETDAAHGALRAPVQLVTILPLRTDQVIKTSVYSTVQKARPDTDVHRLSTLPLGIIPYTAEPRRYVYICRSWTSRPAPMTRQQVCKDCRSNTLPVKAGNARIEEKRDPNARSRWSMGLMMLDMYECIVWEVGRHATPHACRYRGKKRKMEIPTGALIVVIQIQFHLNCEDEEAPATVHRACRWTKTKLKRAPSIRPRGYWKSRAARSRKQILADGRVVAFNCTRDDSGYEFRTPKAYVRETLTSQASVNVCGTSRAHPSRRQKDNAEMHVSNGETLGPTTRALLAYSGHSRSYDRGTHAILGFFAASLATWAAFLSPGIASDADAERLEAPRSAVRRFKCSESVVRRTEGTKGGDEKRRSMVCTLGDLIRGVAPRASTEDVALLSRIGLVLGGVAAVSRKRRAEARNGYENVRPGCRDAHQLPYVLCGDKYGRLSDAIKARSRRVSRVQALSIAGWDSE